MSEWGDSGDTERKVRLSGLRASPPLPPILAQPPAGLLSACPDIDGKI